MHKPVRIIILFVLFAAFMGRAVAQSESETLNPDQRPKITFSQMLIPPPPGSASAVPDPSISFYGNKYEYRRFNCKADVPGWSGTSVSFWADAKIEITEPANRRYFRAVTGTGWGTGWNYESALAEITGKTIAHIKPDNKQL